MIKNLWHKTAPYIGDAIEWLEIHLSGWWKFYLGLLIGCKFL